VAASDLAPAIAIFSGAAGIVSAIGGILLAIRAIRNKERKAAKEEIDELGKELTQERHTRISLERQIYNVRLFLEKHGFMTQKLFPDDNDVIDIPEIEGGGDEPHQLGGQDIP
jgi:methylthioribose-1-phosphate isomerase